MTGAVSPRRGRRALAQAVVGLWPRLLLLVLLLPVGLAAGALAAPDEAPDVEVVREHLFLTRGPAGAQVLHMVELVNLGPRPAQRVPLPVPAEAQWEQLPSPVEAGAGGLVDPRPLAVGEGRQYALIYSLPWREPMVLRRPLLYPTAELWLWAETSGLAVRGVGLVPVGREEIEGLEFAVYHMERLEPHPAWQVVLERPGGGARELPVLMQVGMRSDPAEVLARHPLPRLILAALAVAGIVAGVRRFQARSRAARPDGTGAAGRGGAGGGRAPQAGTGAAGAHALAPGGREEMERLKDQIVQLDVAFHNGELDEDVYRERRAVLKARLLQLSRNGGKTPR